MSYAARLAAMSREGAPKASPRVIGGEAEAPREEHIEGELRAPAPPVAPPRAPGARPARPAPGSAPSPSDEANVQAGVTHVTRETTEPTVVEHHETFAPPASTAHAAPERDRVALPAAAQWLEEDRSAPDPLVAIAETDALRELMQRVRAWTSSAPTVIETAKPAAPVETVAAAAPPGPAPVPEPSHVSIGNVVITVEDAPAAAPRGTRAPAPTRSTTDRMARNYIRGG